MDCQLLWTQLLLKYLVTCTELASISMQNKQECVAWSVGLCQVFKESLVSAADSGGQQGQFAPGPQCEGGPQPVLNSFKVHYSIPV